MPMDKRKINACENGASSGRKLAATMETFFSHADAQFAPVTSAEQIQTHEFLCSCDKVVEFIGFFGTAYTPVKMDVGGNVYKVRTKYDSDMASCQTLDALLKHDCQQNVDDSRLPYAAEGFLWLKRGLQFLCEFLQLLVDNNETEQNRIDRQANSVTAHIRTAYDRTLKPHHGWVSKQLFRMLIIAAPSRSSLLDAVVLHQTIVDRESEERAALDDVQRFLVNFQATVVRAHELCLKYGLERPTDNNTNDQPPS